jgi:hypothetical protein
MSDLSTNAIYDAIRCLEREADFRRNIGGNANYERARDLDRIRQQADAEYNRLSDAMPRLRSLKDEADRAYDRYVTREPSTDGCSCHLSAPCSYCTREVDEDDDGALDRQEARLAEGRGS